MSESPRRERTDEMNTTDSTTTAVGAGGCAVAGAGFPFRRPAVCVVSSCQGVSMGRRDGARRDCVEGNRVIEFPKRTATPKRGRLHTSQRCEERDGRVGSPFVCLRRCIGVFEASQEAATKTRGPSGSSPSHGEIRGCGSSPADAGDGHAHNGAVRGVAANSASSAEVQRGGTARRLDMA